MASFNRAFQCHYISVLYHLQDTTIYVEDIKGYVTLTVPYLEKSGNFILPNLWEPCTTCLNRSEAKIEISLNTT